MMMMMMVAMLVNFCDDDCCLVLKVLLVKEVMSCDVSPVAMFFKCHDHKDNQCHLIIKTNAADDDPWYSALSAAFKKHNLEVEILLSILVDVFTRLLDIGFILQHGE